VISHFLADVSDGSFDGFPELGVLVQTVENEALRRHLGMADGSHGVLVTAVSRRGSAHGVIRPGDIILAIDDLPLLEGNMVELEAGLHVDSAGRR
jgi:S1-C subfamily serine protease